MGTSTTGENTREVMVNTWTGEEARGEGETDEQKRLEIPELSPPPNLGREDKNRDKNRKQEDNRRRTRPSTEELVSMYIPQAPPSLTFQDLDNIDLGEQQFFFVCTYLL